MFRSGERLGGEDDSEYLEIRERPLCELEESLCVSLLKQFDHGCSDLEKGLGGKMTVNILKSGSDPYVNSRNRFAFPYSSSLIMDVQIWRKAWGEDDSEYLEIRERPLCELEESLCVSLLKQFDHGCSDLEKGLGGR